MFCRYSFISGVTILGTPAEIYNFGTQYWITIISLMFAGIVVVNVYLPVFKNLKLNSAYEVSSVLKNTLSCRSRIHYLSQIIIESPLQYLELRFNRGVRILISLIFVVDVVLYQSIVVYVPSLALNQGIHRSLVSPFEHNVH